MSGSHSHGAGITSNKMWLATFWTSVDYVDTGASDKKQATPPRRLHFTSNFIAIQIRFKVPESRNSRTLVQCFVIGIFIFS